MRLLARGGEWAVKLYIKNIGKEPLVLNNPYGLAETAPKAKHLWYAAILQLTPKHGLGVEPLKIYFNEDNNAHKSKHELDEYIQLEPGKEERFTFVLTQAQQAQIASDDYETTLLLGIGFKDGSYNTKHFILTSDAKSLIFRQ